MSPRSPRVLAWTALVSTFVLNLQGTFLRGTGSGDGCGTSWPTCDGAFVPVDPGFATTLEFTHRLITVAVGIIGAALLVQAVRWRRRYPGVLPTVLAAALFFVAQALVGAWTVTAGLTGESTDSLRAVVLPIHLANSFSQLGALVLAVHLTGPRAPRRWSVADRRGVVVLLAVTALAFYGLLLTGGVAALGNLFAPAGSVAEGAALDFSADAPLVVRIRLLHPVIGAALGVALVVSALGVVAFRRNARVRRAVTHLVVVYVVQLGIGTWNLLALAPLPLSLLHQALALVAFGLFVRLAAVVLGERDDDRVDEPTAAGVPTAAAPG